MIPHLEDFLTKVFDSVTDPFVIYDDQFRILRVNQALLALFQSSAAQIIGRHCYEFFYSRSAVCDECHVDEVFRTGEPRMLRKLISLPDGRKRLFEVHSYPVKDGTGKTVQAIEHAQDITERASLEDQLRVSEERYRTIVEAAHTGIFVLDPQLKITFSNRRLAEILGVQPHGIEGHSFFDFASSNSLVEALTTPDSKQSVEVGETSVVRSDGTHCPVLMSLSSLDKGHTPAGFVGIVTDLSSLKKLEEEVRRAKEFNEEIINSITENLVVIDPRSLRVAQANDAFYARVGLRPHEGVGRRCHEIMRGRDTPCAAEGIKCPLEETMRTKRSATCDKTYPNAKKGERLLEISTYPILDPQGEVSWIIRLERDITDKRQMEEALAFRSKELQRTQYQLEMLFEMSRQVSARNSLAELVQCLREICEDVYPSSELLLFLLDSAGHRVLSLEQCDPAVMEPLLRAQQKLLRSGLLSNFVQYLHGVRETPIVSHEQGSAIPSCIQLIAKDYPSWFGFPISTPRQCIGYFVLGSRASQNFSREDIHFFHSLFGQIAGDICHLVLLETEIDLLRQKTGERSSHGEIIGQSHEMQKIYELIDLVAGSDATVLITGENGTGKELAAMAVHMQSHRRKGPFVVANCSAYSPTLLESELFGHEKGAFTGAIKRKKGRIERASGGTLFLDEIGNISPATQVLLLRFLQDHTYERVGGEATLEADVRVLAATNRDLFREVESGRFRDDLYYRLNVISISLPPLRERKEDIPLLSKHFLKKYNLKEGKEILSFSPSAIQALMDYGWPGNIRQLENAVSHAVILAQGQLIDRQHLPIFLRQAPQDIPSATLADNERRLVLQMLQECGWNKHETARRLKVSRSTLYSKIRRYGLK
jgi:PAS domain S-box-containing protein